MESKIIKKDGNRLTLEVQILLDPNSMLNSEEQIQKALNEVGVLATQTALSQFDTDGSSIELEGKKYTSKGKKKVYENSYGPVSVYRHVYQSSQGGSTYVPLEEDARIIRNATPHFARQLSSKYAEVSAQSVQKDLKNNHGRKISVDYIQKISNEVGEVVEVKKRSWTYSLPAQTLDTQIISIGRDGAMMPIRSQGYRETMSGTIGFYNAEGERLHTIYLAQAPEYGKADFNAHFTREIEQVKTLFPNATYIGLADGAKENWTYLEEHVDKCILDYWHACEYLTKASKAFSRSKSEQTQWAANARKQLKKNKTGPKALLRQMNKQSREAKLSKAARKELDKAITYFKNHVHQMSYKESKAQNYPIGSGVTEAACKVIVKQRTNQSGMRWTIPKSQNVLNIRTLHRTEGRWQQFWRKIDAYGVAA